MSLTKRQCKEILKQAKKYNACSSNYEPAKKAYKARDYETFEKICRGNINWLSQNSIDISHLIEDEGPFITHTSSYVTHGFVNEAGDPVGIEIVYDKDTNAISQICSYDEYHNSPYELNQPGYSTPETDNIHLKNIADAIYKHLGISVTITDV